MSFTDGASGPSTRKRKSQDHPAPSDRPKKKSIKKKTVRVTVVLDQPSTLVKRSGSLREAMSVKLERYTPPPGWTSAAPPEREMHAPYMRSDDLTESRDRRNENQSKFERALAASTLNSRGDLPCLVQDASSLPSSRATTNSQPQRKPTSQVAPSAVRDTPFKDIGRYKTSFEAKSIDAPQTSGKLDLKLPAAGPIFSSLAIDQCSLAAEVRL